MLNRIALLGVAIGAWSFSFPVSHCMAESPAAVVVRLFAPAVTDDTKKDDDDKKDADDDKQDGEKHEHDEKKEKKIEQPVPMNMIPQPVLDAVKKEVPSGTITEAELEVKKGKIVYGFDVKDGEMVYDVNITVDGKFISKKVDDDQDDEKDDAGKKKD